MGTRCNIICRLVIVRHMTRMWPEVSGEKNGFGTKNRVSALQNTEFGGPGDGLSNPIGPGAYFVLRTCTHTPHRTGWHTRRRFELVSEAYWFVRAQGPISARKVIFLRLRNRSYHFSLSHVVHSAMPRQPAALHGLVQGKGRCPRRLEPPALDAETAPFTGLPESSPPVFPHRSLPTTS